MALPVLYRAAARFEIVVAARDYEERRSGLGATFLDEIARLEAHLAREMGFGVDDGSLQPLRRRERTVTECRAP